MNVASNVCAPSSLRRRFFGIYHMPIYHGYLEAYWEQGWEGRIEYALSFERQSAPFFLANGQHLTIYAPDDAILWQGRLHFVGRGREQHTLPTGIWADVKQESVPYGRWIAWFLERPALRATVVEDELTAQTDLAQQELNVGAGPAATWRRCRPQAPRRSDAI